VGSALAEIFIACYILCDKREKDVKSNYAVPLEFVSFVSSFPV
jgi:hypothetical protein